MYNRLKDFQQLLIARKEDGTVLTIDDYINFINFNDNMLATFTMNSGEQITVMQSTVVDEGIFNVYRNNKELIATIDHLQFLVL